MLTFLFMDINAIVADTSGFLVKMATSLRFVLLANHLTGNILRNCSKKERRKMANERRCVECGKIIPEYRAKNPKIITCSKICSNKRATTSSEARRR